MQRPRIMVSSGSQSRGEAIQRTGDSRINPRKATAKGRKPVRF